MSSSSWGMSSLTSATKRLATDPPETRARVGDDRRPNEAERRTAPAAVEPGPASPVVLARSRTTTRDDDDDDGDERRTVPFPARSRRGGGSPRLVDSQTPANLAFARSRPGGRAAPRPTSVPPPTAAAEPGPAAKEPGPAAKEPGPATSHSSEPGRVGVSGLARSRREKSEGPTTTPAGEPAAAAIKWGAAKGKVVAPRTPGVADVAARVVAEMARSRRPAKD